MEVGVLALATLLQASCNVSDRDAVELTVMEKRWQLVLACLGAAQPPFSQSTLCNFRMRLIAPDLDQRLLERTVALAEQTGGFGARQLRAALDSPPCTERADDPPTDLLEDLGNVRIAGRLALDKARLEACLGAIEIDALKEDNVIMHMHGKRSTTPCRPP